MRDFKRFKRRLSGKGKFYRSWTGKEISHKDCEHVLEV